MSTRPRLPRRRPAFGLAAVVALGLGVAGAANAETYCGKAGQDVRAFMGDAILGDWVMQPLGGYAMVGGEVFPYPPMQPITTSIFPGEGGRIFAVNQEMTDSVELVTDDRPDAFPAPGGFPGQAPPSEGDIGIVAGCDARELPRLIARSKVVTKDSVLDLRMRLIVVGPGIMYGMIDSSGNVGSDSFEAVRAISLTK